jgi:hypothetical protein
MVDDNRLKATQALIERLQSDYPTEGFKLSPSIDFVSQSDGGGGIGVVAKQKIRKDDVLLVIPAAARLSAKAILPSTLTKQLMKEITNKSQFQEYQKMLSPLDYVFAVAIMKVLAKKDCVDERDDLFVKQARTWPSEESMKDTSWFYWDVDAVQKIWNRSGMFMHFEELRSNVDTSFDNIICPHLLKQGADSYIDQSLPSNTHGNATSPSDRLRNTFMYALSLLYSRAHEAHEKGEDTGEILPLIELFNGSSERMNEYIKKKPEKTIINVDIARGKWPFIKGCIFRDDCNLPCTAVYACRDIDEGEELILSYGDLSPNYFAYKYGTIPDEFIKHHNVMSDISLYVPKELIPNDEMRRKCLERSGYPLDEFSTNKNCALGHIECQQDSIVDYMNGYESPLFMSIRQFLVLSSCKLMEDELQRNYTTGKLRGPLYQSEALRRFCDLFQYNIELLGGKTSSTEDAIKATNPHTPSWERCCLLARISYRESLLMWQRAVAIKAMDASLGVFGAADADIPYLGQGCAVCGRSYPELKCGKCNSVGRKVQYCCRGHQQLDWREHKLGCGKF